MGIVLASNFNVNAALPLDSRQTVADLTARDAIVAGVRYEGMTVFVESDGKTYQLVGGITNGDWATFGAGGGGGGSALKWYASGAKAPYLTISSNLEVAQFSNGETQEYFAAYRVPASYEAGTQITVKIMSYSANSSGTILMKTLSTLIRTATDVVSSTTNQHTSTTASYTASGTTQNKIVETTLDITDATGLINSVAVSAGDVILIKLYRDTDTATGEVNLFPYSSEVISA